MPRREPRDFVELSHFELDEATVRRLPLSFAARNRCVVLGKVDTGSFEPVQLGMVDPAGDGAVVELLSNRWGRPIEPVLLNQFEVDRALDVGYPGARAIIGLHELDLRTPAPGPDSTPADLLDDALMIAVARLASDLHIEAFSDDVDVRIRVDGVLEQLNTRISPANLPAVVGRVKALANLDIAERRGPQDGRFRCSIVDGSRRSVRDFRVSVLPGPSGEDVVIRVLDTTAGLRPVTQLGLAAPECARLLDLLSNPEGLIVVTGPTGSGKTTTLYSALLELQTPQRKIITAEDPIEFWLPKISQKQVGPKASYAELVRAFLRQDPDVLLVGEVRDEQTAWAAARAASTGHLVLTTLHSADPVGTLVRLRNLGLPDDVLAESLLAVLGQRLLRRICPGCSHPAFLTAEQEAALGPLAANLEPQRGVGCDACRGGGYLGRVGVFELAVFTRDLQDAITAGASPTEMRALLEAQGHRSIVDDALDKIRAGVTTVDELLRAIPRRLVSAATQRRARAHDPAQSTDHGQTHGQAHGHTHADIT